MEEFWRVAPKQIRSPSLSGSLGIVCPICGVHLKVLQGRVQVSWLLAFAVPIAVALLVGRAIPLDSGTVSAKAHLLPWVSSILRDLHCKGTTSETPHAALPSRW